MSLAWVLHSLCLHAVLLRSCFLLQLQETECVFSSAILWLHFVHQHSAFQVSPCVSTSRVVLLKRHCSLDFVDSLQQLVITWEELAGSEAHRVCAQNETTHKSRVQMTRVALVPKLKRQSIHFSSRGQTWLCHGGYG